MNFRYRLNHSVLGPKSITEPDGWKGSKIELERDKLFYSLIEHYDGSANGAFIFYGSDEFVDGGVNYIKQVEQTYGFDADIEFEADFSDDDETYENVFTGLLDIVAKNEMKDNKMQVPVIREDFWAKFINRMDTPVDLTSNVDLDGNAVSPVTPITVNLTSQLLRKKYEGYNGDGNATSNIVERWDIPANEYGIIDMPNEILNEITTKYSYPITDSPTIPFQYFDVEFGGEYTFDIQLITWSIIEYSHVSASIQAYLKVNEGTPTALTKTNLGSTPGVDHRTAFTYNNTITLNAGDDVRIYLVNSSGGTVTVTMPKRGIYESFVKVTADTLFPETTAQGYLLHDAFHGVMARLGMGTNAFYSEFLGSTMTNSRVYGSNGCGWMYALLKGLQIRGYTLTEKPFFTSFNHLWSGANPILNLGLGYEMISGVNSVRIEEKDHWFDDTMSILFSSVRDIESGYDKNHIFKKITAGYKDWESESSSGIDDPQTKRTYATRFTKSGVELDLESEFMAASLAIEACRRSKKKKSEDYKHDNKTFIIALNDNDVSPDRYTPELDENFDSITGLLNSETRYNSVLTPVRSFLRWANVTGGCLQLYLTSSYKFVSGEGNFDMIGDYSCAFGNQCQGVICDPLSEKSDISLTSYNSLFGHLFYPMDYKISIPMSWSEFKTIKSLPKQAIGISQGETNHQPFFIKKISYDMVNAKADIVAWPKDYFDISARNSDFEMKCT